MDWKNFGRQLGRLDQIGATRGWALALAFVAFVVLFTHHAVVLEGTFKGESLRHDSLQYYRDALVLRHKLFGIDTPREAFVRDGFARYGLRISDGGRVYFRFGDRLLHAVRNATLLQLLNGDVRGIFWSNLVCVVLAGMLITYVCVREFGAISAPFAIVALILFGTFKTVPTLYLETGASLGLVLMGFFAWLSIRRRHGTWCIFALMIVCLGCVFYKNGMKPFAYPMALLAGWLLGRRIWRRRQRSAWGNSLAAVIVPILLFLVHLMGSAATRNALGLPHIAFTRSNAPYALWMGSLPSDWTGTYSGRISSYTYRYSYTQKANSLYHRQAARVAETPISRYDVPFDVVWPMIRRNYLADPADAATRFAFRYTKITRLCRWNEPRRLIVAMLAIAGSAGIVLMWRRRLLPFVFLMQAVAWMHAVSRYRARDEEQLSALTALTATVAVWGIYRMLRAAVVRLRRARTPQRRVPGAAGWVRGMLSVPLLSPILLATIFPGVLSKEPPELLEFTWKTSRAAGPKLYVNGRVDAAHLLVELRTRYVRPGEHRPMRWLDQADAHGRFEFAAPLEDIGDPRKHGIKVRVWSKTEQVTWAPLPKTQETSRGAYDP